MTFLAVLAAVCYGQAPSTLMYDLLVTMWSDCVAICAFSTLEYDDGFILGRVGCGFAQVFSSLEYNGRFMIG